MAKDPAFLFYSSDFLVGTYTMTDEQVGQYVRLLCLQHQHGHLDESTMQLICQLDNSIMAKFKVDESGCYYNERLDEEVDRRNTYTESRRKNAQPKHTESICKAHAQHMDKHMETVTVTNTPTKHKYGRYKNVLLTDEQLETLKGEFPDWEKRIEALSEYIESKGASYKNHLATIRAWARKDKDTTGKPVSRHKVSFQDYDQDQGVEQVIPTGPDLLKEARKLREQNA